MRRAGYNLARIRRPHRLAAQDGALSRPKQGFESPWGHKRVIENDGSFLIQTGARWAVEGHFLPPSLT
jgi:hypothetical protein